MLTAAHCVQGADPGELSVRLAGRRHAWRGAIFPRDHREIPSPVAPENPQATATHRGRVGTEESYNQL